MKQNMVCNFRGIMVIALAALLLLCSGGCGEQQRGQTGEVKDLVTTGSAVYIAGEEDTEEVQKQLKLLVKNADKWLIDDDGIDPSYAVTDLDHNGRLEIMALGYDLVGGVEDEGNILRKCFEVNPSGDGIQEIRTEQLQEVVLGYEGIEEFDKAYFDSETGEYHYVIDVEYYDDNEDYDYTDIISWTLKDGQIIKTTLGTCERIGKKRKDFRYFRVDGEEKTEITEEECSVEKLGDFFYASCEKFDVWFSTFTFEHNLEEHIYYAMEKAYGECFQGYPLEKQEKEIHGYSIAVPQYTAIQDSGKQKRINRMICEQMEQSLNDAYGDLQDSEFNLEYADITIKYAGRNRVSLLLEARGYHEGSVTSNEHCDTITIDLEQEKILSGQDILPKKYQEEIEAEIEEGYAEGFHGGDAYQKILEEKEANLFPTMRAEGWQDVKIYQTRDDVGVVIPTKYGLDAYIIYEVQRDWYDDVVIAYPDVDWEAYQYKMLPVEYQSLQSYMPVLTGGSEFTLIKNVGDDWSENVPKVERQNITITDLVGKCGGEDMADETLILASIGICDLTQDGEDELILNFFNIGSLHLILHQEGDIYYGIIHGRRSLYNLQKNGVYGAGKNGLHFYQTRFEKDTFVETYIGGYEYEWDDSGEEDCKYYIGDKEVEKEEYKKWKRSIAAEEVLWYTPEILQEKMEDMNEAEYSL